MPPAVSERGDRGRRIIGALLKARRSSSARRWRTGRTLVRLASTRTYPRSDGAYVRANTTSASLRT